MTQLKLELELAWTRPYLALGVCRVVDYWTCLVSCQPSYFQAGRAQPGAPLCNNTKHVSAFSTRMVGLFTHKSANSHRTEIRQRANSRFHLLDSSEFSSKPYSVPAPPDGGRCEAWKLWDEVGFKVLLLCWARTEWRTEVWVAVVLDPVDHQVVAVSQAGEGGWPGKAPTPDSHFNLFC